MTTSVPLQLSQVKPDFESLLMQLQMYLDGRATWKDLLTSSTGETLMELMSAVGAFNQFAIESAARESYLNTALRDSSIYAITRMLGVRISRKRPAAASISLTRSGDISYSYVIPRFSQFNLNGKPFFNRSPIVFNAGNIRCVLPAYLYEGTVRTQTFTATSETFREIYLNEPNFTVSDVDVEVKIENPVIGDSRIWQPIQQGIWTAEPGDYVYYDSTAGNGDTIIAFGDGYHGAMPPVSHNIVIKYAVTAGADANNGTISKIAIKLNSDATISGSPGMTGAISNGANQQDASYYRVMAPHIYKARTRAVTPVDYKAIASSYGDVASVTVHGQKDIAPNDLRWMNVVRICILPQSSNEFSEDQWNDFETWFKQKAHAAVYIQRYNPNRLVRNVNLTLALKPQATPAVSAQLAEANIRTLFSKDVTTLAKRIALSDIIEAAKVLDVDYVDMNSPTSDLICPDEFSYYALGSLAISTRYSERTVYRDDRGDLKI